MSEPYLLPNDRVLRYSFRERVLHWVAGLSYIYLLLTGLAASAPAPDAYDYFGLTPDKVATRITDFMKQRGFQ